MRGMIARSAGVGLVLATVSVTLTAGPAKKPASPTNSGTPVVTDWSHRHLIFSHPTTPEQAARVQRDVRLQCSRIAQSPGPSSKPMFGAQERNLALIIAGDFVCTATGK